MKNLKFSLFSMITITISCVVFISCKQSSNEINQFSKEENGKITTTTKQEFKSEYLKNSKLQSNFYNEKIWSSSDVDLNGDEIKDKIDVYSNKDYLSKLDEPSSYILKICINNICFDQEVYFSGNSYYGKQTKFDIIDINKSDGLKELLVSFKQSANEDPSYNHSIFRYFSNDIITVSEITSTGYNNGQINYQDDNSFTVDHGRLPEIKGTYTLNDLYVKQSSIYFQPDAEIDYSNMAACPFVYLLEGKNKVFKGEILRYLSADYTESWQTLNLNLESEKSKNIKIIISEEKDETSYINAIFLMADGKIYAPKITDSNFKKLINDDQDYFKLEKGESIELEFELEEGNIDTAVIHAKGYYLPFPNYTSLKKNLTNR